MLADEQLTAIFIFNNMSSPSAPELSVLLVCVCVSERERE